MRVCVIGGAGYIGNILCNDLCRFSNVLNIDNQIYFKGYTKFIDHINYSEINKDFRENLNFNDYFKQIDAIVILGGLVGDPITKKYPDESISINEDAILNVISKSIEFKIPKIIFVSTCSNYGKLPSNLVADENTPLAPLSLYAKSKVKIEKFLMQSFSSSTCITILRFATAFGMSPRMRYDLTVNQFVREAYYKKYIEIYDGDTYRPYCHVKDFSKIIQKIIINKDTERFKNQIFNVGRDDNNCSKKELVHKIAKQIPNFEYKFVENSSDQRNYIVNFSKIKDQLLFKPKFSIDDGIYEILKSLKNGLHPFSDRERYGNYELIKT